MLMIDKDSKVLQALRHRKRWGLSHPCWAYSGSLVTWCTGMDKTSSSVLVPVLLRWKAWLEALLNIASEILLLCMNAIVWRRSKASRLSGRLESWRYSAETSNVVYTLPYVDSLCFDWDFRSCCFCCWKMIGYSSRVHIFFLIYAPAWIIASVCDPRISTTPIAACFFSPHWLSVVWAARSSNIRASSGSRQTSVSLPTVSYTTHSVLRVVSKISPLLPDGKYSE